MHKESIEAELVLGELHCLEQWAIAHVEGAHVGDAGVEDATKVARAYEPLVTRLLALPQGSLVLLLGDLGAGKTTCVSALMAALESPARVSSPSYTLIHEYPSPQGTVVHIDAYKFLPSTAQPFTIVPSATHALQTLGLEDYLDDARLVLVEWGASLMDAFSDVYVLSFTQELSSIQELSTQGLSSTQEKGQRYISLYASQALSADAHLQKVVT